MDFALIQNARSARARQEFAKRVIDEGKVHMNQTLSDRPEMGQVAWLDEEIAEISLLIPAWQAAQLVTMATVRNVTVGQMLRSLIREYLVQQDSASQHQESEGKAPHFGEQGNANS